MKQNWIDDLLERYDERELVEYVDDCWGSDPMTATLGEIVTMVRELGYDSGDFRTRPGSRTGEAVLVDSIGNTVLRLVSTAPVRATVEE